MQSLVQNLFIDLGAHLGNLAPWNAELVGLWMRPACCARRCLRASRSFLAAFVVAVSFCGVSPALADPIDQSPIVGPFSTDAATLDRPNPSLLVVNADPEREKSEHSAS